MTIQDVKQIKLADYLQSLGYTPVKQQGRNLWYKSPLREETDASFKVNTELEKWYDFGIGKGGNILALAAELYHSEDVAYLLKRIEERTAYIRPASFSFGRQHSDNQPYQGLRVGELSSPALIAYLQERGINIGLAKRECRELRFMNADSRKPNAGIRKKAKVNEDIEYYSVIRSIRSIENSDVCILMIDATRGIEAQDVNIFSLIQKNKKGLVVCVNKWDLVEDKSTAAIKHFEAAIRDRFAPFADFPIIFTSALTKQRIYKVLETAVEVYNNRKRIVPTSQLNNYMQEVIGAYPPPANKGKYVKIKYVTMLKDQRIPTFVFFCNLPQWVKEPYRRYLENKIREQWDFTGTPINLYMREK